MLMKYFVQKTIVCSRYKAGVPANFTGLSAETNFACENFNFAWNLANFDLVLGELSLNYRSKKIFY